MSLPKNIYGQWQNDTGGLGDGFFRTEIEMQEFVGSNESRIVGVYELVGTVKIESRIHAVFDSLKTPSKKAKKSR